MAKNRGSANRQSNRRPEPRMTRRQRQAQEQQVARQSVDQYEAELELKMNRPIFGKLEARTPKQQDFINMVEEKRLTFVKGPAGTGKTFLSTSIAVEALERGEIDKIVITRPMVGCDEDIGFVPGDELEKFMGWLGPFIDVLEGKLGKKKVETYIKYGKIVAKPLMMMRGSTFRDAFIILDEAQNTTEGQMKMFLTRLGQGSKVVVTGDIEQSDLVGKRSGLADALDILHESRSVGIFEFGEDDIVRDPLVRDIVKAYRRKYVKKEMGALLSAPQPQGY